MKPKRRNCSGLLIKGDLKMSEIDKRSPNEARAFIMRLASYVLILIGQVLSIILYVNNLNFWIDAKNNNDSDYFHDFDYYEKLVSEEKSLIAVLVILVLAVVTMMIIMLVHKKQSSIYMVVPLIASSLYCLAMFILDSWSYCLIMTIVGCAATLLIVIGLKRTNKVLLIVGSIITIVYIILYVVMIIDRSTIWEVLNILSLICILLQILVLFVFKNKKSELSKDYSLPLATIEDPTIGNADRIMKYKELLDMGVITQEEFEEKKKELLDL